MKAQESATRRPHVYASCLLQRMDLLEELPTSDSCVEQLPRPGMAQGVPPMVDLRGCFGNPARAVSDVTGIINAPWTRTVMLTRAGAQKAAVLKDRRV